MTDDAKTSPETIFEQFRSIVENTIPEQYKPLLAHFNEQGLFYQQFIQSLNSKETDLSSFWALPNSWAEKGPTTEQTKDWFKCFYTLNAASANNEAPAMDTLWSLFNPSTQQAHDSLKDLHGAFVDINQLHTELGQLALLRFEQLQQQIDAEPTEEHVCKHWLQAGEETFKKVSQTEPYIDAQRRLFEALNQLKTQQQVFGTQLSQQLGLPSQQAIDDLKTALHQLRIEFSNYKEHTEATIHRLDQRLKKRH
ncbi:MAG: hypothetical protein KBT50_03580 [Cycloclasticus sp.]|nr:hypothetical protein [Cycloclasticus sp.]MBQ0789676.1 hypothetical protein [Cycloclasticus sp.]